MGLLGMRRSIICKKWVEGDSFHLDEIERGNQIDTPFGSQINHFIHRSGIQPYLHTYKGAKCRALIDSLCGCKDGHTKEYNSCYAEAGHEGFHFINIPNLTHPHQLKHPNIRTCSSYIKISIPIEKPFNKPASSVNR